MHEKNSKMQGKKSEEFVWNSLMQRQSDTKKKKTKLGGGLCDHRWGIQNEKVA